jgi:hypothetical protein
VALTILCGALDISMLVSYYYLVTLGTLVPFGTNEVRGCYVPVKLRAVILILVLIHGI